MRIATIKPRVDHAINDTAIHNTPPPIATPQPFDTRRWSSPFTLYSIGHGVFGRFCCAEQTVPLDSRPIAGNDRFELNWPVPSQPLSTRCNVRSESQYGCHGEQLRLWCREIDVGFVTCRPRLLGICSQRASTPMPRLSSFHEFAVIVLLVLDNHEFGCRSPNQPSRHRDNSVRVHEPRATAYGRSSRT